LTSYFYQFDGDQGDVFINVVARNFAGDIDVFTLNGLRPLTKIVVYGDFGESETGRVIYLRKPEKMILRVQGRTPGDDPATFRIKFAGSFVASTMAEPLEPTLPSLTAKNESGIRVNSVGTIVEIIPKSTPTAPVETASSADDRNRSDPRTKDRTDVPAETKNDDRANDPSAGAPYKKLEVVVSDNANEKTEGKAATATPARRGTRGRVRPKTATPAEPGTTTDPDPVVKIPPSAGRRGRTTAAKAAAAKVPDPLENVNLIILFKDGTTIELPMSEVLRFSVDRGMLTVISKDGSIGRYSILDVAKLTVQ
ncbi:MAG: hypothetical protein ABJB34_07545, partial [Acidobacteriota bacterium]